MFVAIINTPGYLSEQDDPPTFDTAREAWQYLADERKRAEDDSALDVVLDNGLDADLGYSGTANTLERLGTSYDCGTDADYENAGLDPIERTGTVYGPTPGYDGDHDLGVAYTVQEVES